MRFAPRNRTLMAIAATAAFLVVGAATSAQASVTLRGAVPSTYSYDLNWQPHKRVLSGLGAVRVENVGPEPIDHFWLRLRANRGDSLESLKWVSSARISATSPDGSMVKLSLLKPLAPGAVRYVSFGVHLRVPRANTSLGRSAGMDLFGDALPVVAVEGPRGIRVGPEPLYGEGSMNAVAQWSVSMRVPRGLSVVLPGGMTRTNRTRTSSTYGVDAIDIRDVAFAIGRFRTVSRMVGNVEVSVVGSGALRDQLKPALRRAVNAFRAMQRWYGGYNLYYLRVVLGDLPFGGSEYPSVVFSTPDNATIAHEVAHQWFYGLVGNDQYNDPFLDESLTAFAEQRFHKSYSCNLARPITGLHGLGTGMYYWENHAKAYEDTIYRGGACALTVLRTEIGASAFDRALRAYVAANTDQIAGVEDFLVAVRTAAPTYDLARWQRLVGLS